MSRFVQYSAVSLLPFLHFFGWKLLFAAHLRQENICMIVFGQGASQNTLRWGRTCAILGLMRRIICIILAFTITLLCGCGSRSNGDDTQDYGGNTQQTEEFVITPMASGLELEPYTCADFSMSVPEGWMVEAATSNAGMYHALRAYDPACSVNQILYILKAEPLFADDFLKQNYTYWNAAYAAFPVMAEESVKGYFDVLPQ